MGYLNEDGLATLVGKVKGQVVQLTAAEYRQIPAETKNTDNKIYFVEDDDYAYAIDNEPTLNSENLVKSGGVYNYTSKIGTGALTTTAQTLIPAVNELKAEIDTNASDIATLNNGLMDIQNYSFSLPSGWSVNYQICKRVGKTVYLSGMFMHSTGQTAKSFVFSNVIPADIALSGRVAFSGFDNATDASLHGIIQGRTITFYRSETTSIKDIEFSVVYSLI